jgi:micrococcal nuclease
LSRPRVFKRPTIVALAVFLALVAAALRGPCRRAVRTWSPAAAPPPPPASIEIDRVFDGDTVLTTAGRTIRIIGLDAPELDDPSRPLRACARRARDALHTIVGGTTVRATYELELTDRYGRTLANLYAASPADEVLVAEELIRRGLASIYLIPPNLEHRDRLKAAQREAVAADRGLWSIPVRPEARYVVGAYKFHRPRCPHARDIPRPEIMADRRAILMAGKSPCRRCRP